MITDKQVEAACVAMHGEMEFSMASEKLRDRYLGEMRAALEAAEAARGGSVTLVGEPGVIMTKADYPNPGAHTPLRPAVQDADGLAAWEQRREDDLHASLVASLRPAPAAQGEAVAEVVPVLSGRFTTGVRILANAEELAKLPVGTKLYTTPQPSAPSEPNAAWVDAVESYAAAARVIALHLKKFCDETLPYPEMIADAARNAAAEIERLSAQPSADDALAGYQLRQMKLSGDERYGKWRECGRADYEVVSETGTFVDGDGIRWPAEARKVYTAPPADARDAEDARRYRKIRHSEFELGLMLDKLSAGVFCMKSDEDLDAAIDAAPDPADRAMGATGGEA